MIYTVTFNPSLDYIVRADHFKAGVINRTTYENILPGGKGINVSIVLKNMGHESTALGFIAGFTGREICTRLATFGVLSDFIEIPEGMSRINLKMKSDEETEINGQGPVITAEALEALYERRHWKPCTPNWILCRPMICWSFPAASLLRSRMMSMSGSWHVWTGAESGSS